MVKPDASIIALRFSITLLVCSAAEPVNTFPLSGSKGNCPEQKSISDAVTLTA
jgi:hypothetical protein